MHRVNMLRHFGVRPILVFDGGLLPIKSYQEGKRARYALVWVSERANMFQLLMNIYVTLTLSSAYVRP
jgi:hypothetical protein